MARYNLISREQAENEIKAITHLSALKPTTEDYKKGAEEMREGAINTIHYMNGLGFDEIRRETAMEILREIAEVLKDYESHGALIAGQPNVWKGTIYFAIQSRFNELAKKYGIDLESDDFGDVVEVMRGIWLKPVIGKLGALCSVCDTQHDNKTNFCPNCGADMRERADNNDN